MIGNKLKGSDNVRERPYAITIMDRQGRIYFLTEELTPDIWSKKEGSRKSSSQIRFFFRKRTEDVCLHSIKLFQTTELARDFWMNNFENSKTTIDNLCKYYDLKSLSISKILLIKKEEEPL